MAIECLSLKKHPNQWLLSEYPLHISFQIFIRLLCIWVSYIFSTSQLLCYQEQFMKQTMCCLLIAVFPVLSTAWPHSGYLENASWNTFFLASVWCWLKFPSGEIHFCVRLSSRGLLVWCRAILSTLVQRESPSLDFIRVLKIRDGRECSPEVVYCPFSLKSPERTLAVPQELQSGVKA